MCENGRNVVLDTKWKRLSSSYDLSVADMHQMYAYGQRYRGESEDMQHVVLIFPWNNNVDPAKLKRGLYVDGRHVSRDGVQVDLFFFRLANARESIDDLLWLIEELAGERNNG
jgi:5-methylcytosine-specific restriction endonuclease McrBC regulatory subunit McrC